MKTILFSTIQIALTALVLTLCASAFSQNTTIWKGGKPGRATDWNCAANWSGGRVPNEFAQVIIPSDLTYYPVIKSEVEPIDALLMEGGTALTLQKDGSLSVLGETGRFGSITVLGKIMNNGTLEIRNVTSMSMAFLQQIQGEGKVVSDTTSLAKQ